MLDYSNAKTSIQIEEQFPLFVRREGPMFVEFIKTYYDWLERRVALLTLKAQHTITSDQLEIGQTISSGIAVVASETDDILIDEGEDEASIYDNTYSLTFDGVENYMEVNTSILNVASDWTLGIWFNLVNYPSVTLNDFDVITLSALSYFPLVKISKLDNQIHSIISGVDIDTNIDIRTNEWNYVSIRHNSSSSMLYYDVFNFRGVWQYAAELSLSGLTSDKFVVGADLYAGTNFTNAKFDQLAIWNKCLSNTEVAAIYNDGTPIDITANTGLYASSNNVTDLWEFNASNTAIAVNSVNTAHNGVLMHTPEYDFDIPINIGAIISEYEETLHLLMNILSFTSYEGAIDGVLSNRMLVFAEHIFGKLQKDTVLSSSPENTIIIDDFVEAKNPLNVINNLENYQEIDFSFTYDNFISNDFFQLMLKEIMPYFPLFLHPTHDLTIKALVGKTIKDFYTSKGTLASIKYLWKILYNEDLVLGSTLYSDGLYSYVIVTRYATSDETSQFLRAIAHPIGYNFTLVSP